MPGLPVHHPLPEFTQTHAHRISDAIQPSHPLSSPSPPAPNPSQHQSLFQWVNSSHEVARELSWWQTLKHVWTWLFSSQSVLHAACPEGYNFLGHEGSHLLRDPWRHDLWGSESFLGPPQPHVCLPYKIMKVNLYVFFCLLDSQRMIFDRLTWERWSKYKQKLPNTCELTPFL